MCWGRKRLSAHSSVGQVASINYPNPPGHPPTDPGESIRSVTLQNDRCTLPLCCWRKSCCAIIFYLPFPLSAHTPYILNLALCPTFHCRVERSDSEVRHRELNRTWQLFFKFFPNPRDGDTCPYNEVAKWKKNSVEGVVLQSSRWQQLPFFCWLGPSLASDSGLFSAWKLPARENWLCLESDVALWWRLTDVARYLWLPLALPPHTATNT